MAELLFLEFEYKWLNADVIRYYSYDSYVTFNMRYFWKDRRHTNCAAEVSVQFKYQF